MMYQNWIELLLILLCLTSSKSQFGGLHYFPDVGNIAIGRSITASSVCGETGPEQYCYPTPGEECAICDSQNDVLSHPPSLMIDGDSQTWWQSENNVSSVTVHLDLGKTFFFTHISISFKSLRPAAMLLEKSNDNGYSYVILQYYSTDCMTDFGLMDSKDTPGTAICTSIYSPPTPGEVLYNATDGFPEPDLSNSSHVEQFTITKLRIKLLRLHPIPGNDPPTSEATVRLFYAIYNLEVFGWCFCNGHEDGCGLSELELSTIGIVPSECRCANYTAGIHCEECSPLFNNVPWKTGFDPAFNGCQECSCNDHASSCRFDISLNSGVCDDCDDNTAGDMCEICADGFYRNSEVSMNDINTCIECQCNKAGTIQCLKEDDNSQIPPVPAGTCSCLSNVTGELCDECGPGFLRFNPENDSPCQTCSCPDCEPHTGRCPCDPSDILCCSFDKYATPGPNLTVICESCDCHPNGSYGVCHNDSTCVCKPGVGGVRCDQCLPGYHSLTDMGCTSCDCNPGGSTNTTACNVDTGECECRQRVEGVKCDTCPNGTLGPVVGSAVPCIECFCSGYSGMCESQSGWYGAETVSNGISGWRATGDIIYENGLRVSIPQDVESDILRIYLPSSFLGDRQTAYGEYFFLTAYIPYYEENQLYLEIVGKPSRLPRIKLKSVLPMEQDMSTYMVPLLEDEFTEELYYSKPADVGDMHMALARVTDIKLIVTFASNVPTLDRYINITLAKLTYATNDLGNPDIPEPLSPSLVGEECSCPKGRRGSRCQYCSESYTLDPSLGGEFSSCVECFCHGNAESCDPMSGECIDCAEGTTGPHCEQCASGYYRNQTTSECLPCNCPGGPNAVNQFAETCSLQSGDRVVCDCFNGFVGDRCEFCQNGLVGNPTFENGTCRNCTCNQNSDNGTNICDDITGDCICAEGYIGENCEFCDLGYYGDPFSNNCTDCSCRIGSTVSNTYCHLVTGQCLCLDNVEGRACDQCLPNGTTGLLPRCELCDECSTQWEQPITDLENSVTEYINISMGITIKNITYTEYDNGRLVQPLRDLLTEIKDILNSSMIVSLQDSVLSVHMNLTAHIQVLENQINRAEMIEANLIDIENTSNSLFIELENITSNLLNLKSILMNLSQELGQFEFLNFTRFVSIIEESAARSSRYYNISIYTIPPLVQESNETLDRFAIKEQLFLSISEQVTRLFELICDKLRAYQNLLLEADQQLCGADNDQLRGSDPCDFDINERCEGECGGVGCVNCGGGGCNGSVSEVSRATNLSSRALREAEMLRQELLQQINLLNEANATSIEAQIAHNRVRNLAEFSRTSIQELLVDFQNLTEIVEELSMRRLTDLDQIGILQNQTLLFQLNRTLEEVLVLLDAINGTIDMIRDLSDINGTDLRIRAENALKLSMQANNTAYIILGNVLEINDQLDNIRSVSVQVEQGIDNTKSVETQVQSTTSEARQLLDSAENNISILERRVQSLNNSLQSVRESFARNRQQLLLVRRLTKETENRTGQLEESTSSLSTRLTDLNETATEKLSAANEGLMNATVLYERMISLRNISHTQMLRARGLQNQRECIINEQLLIRDDIQRVAAELEILNNEIETHIARNTICLRRTTLSKRKK